MATYETKFNLGDRVWGISDHRFEQIVRCKPCKNTGKIIIENEDLICPKCNGRSTHTQYAGQKSYVSEFGTEVGKVNIEHVDGPYTHWHSDGEPNPKISYMVSSTGVGSGQVWPEDRLFHSEEEAQKYCDKKNGLLPIDETEHGEQTIGLYGKVL